MNETELETYNPWTVVNLVFSHLAEIGLHPTLGTDAAVGDAGDPSEPAAALLRALGIAPALEGDARMPERRRQHLAALRAAVMDEP
ncbi:MAG TPA: hypothetical protein VKB75_08505 [Jatrophihabitans sp.]|nr:hypothetical protein [Jatrophihabitans sp.]